MKSIRLEQLCDRKDTKRRLSMSSALVPFRYVIASRRVPSGCRGLVLVCSLAPAGPAPPRPGPRCMCSK